MKLAGDIVVMRWKKCIILVGKCTGKSYALLHHVAFSKSYHQSLFTQFSYNSVYSLEYVFTCTMCFGNFLPSMGIVYTNVKLQ
jgi:hypothetical protein